MVDNGPVSYLTELMINAAPEDEHVVSALSFELSGERFGRPDDNTGRIGWLKPIGDAFGGYKLPHSNLWAGVLNYADETAILDHLAGQLWIRPDRLQVLLCSEDEDWFRLYMLRDGQLYQYGPRSEDQPI